jgi:hypothetical protein
VPYEPADRFWLAALSTRLPRRAEALRDRDQQSAERSLELDIRRTRVKLSRHPEVFHASPASE